LRSDPTIHHPQSNWGNTTTNHHSSTPKRVERTQKTLNSSRVPEKIYRLPPVILAVINIQLLRSNQDDLKTQPHPKHPITK
ncbi:hypothetical protein, partial [Gaoshiqia sediminis]